MAPPIPAGNFENGIWATPRRNLKPTQAS